MIDSFHCSGNSSLFQIELIIFWTSDMDYVKWIVSSMMAWII